MNRVPQRLIYGFYVSLMVVSTATMPMAVAAPVTIFEDTFDSDPAANGWTEFAFGFPAVPSITDSGGSAFFNGVSNSSIMSITQAISTLGYENITIELVAFQANTGYESVVGGVDIFNLSVGGSSVFQSTGVFTGVNGSAVDGPGNTVATSTGTIVLPASAENQSSLLIGVGALTTEADEDFFITNIRVAGELIAAVPEASSAFLFGTIALGFFYWQSRRRMASRLV